MGTRELLQAVTAFLAGKHIDYAVIGAYALYGYGYVRATRDIDILTRLEHQAQVVGFLEQLGFETTHRSDAFSNHLHPLRTTQVDIMYVEGTTAQRIFSETNDALLLEGLPARVVSPEHLIALKLFSAANDHSRRLRDLADVREVVVRAGVDKGDVWHYFEKYGLEAYGDEVFGEE